MSAPSTATVAVIVTVTVNAVRVAAARAAHATTTNALRAVRTSALALGCALTACASGPPAPDWAVNAHGALTRFEAAWLRGDTRIAQGEFARARTELARTGRPDRVAHAELVRCAMQAASLDIDDCPAFAPLAADAGPALRAYADYLAGRWQDVDAALLPPQHRAVPAGGIALAAIDDPVSRLVAAGAQLRAGRLTPESITTAIDTASAQGWRRPLLAWLTLQERRAQAAGDTTAAAALRRRIALVAGDDSGRTR